jgi:hypothetical protein
MNRSWSLRAGDFNKILGDDLRESSACWIAGFHFGESGAKRFGKQTRLGPAAGIRTGLPFPPPRARADAGIECHVALLAYRSNLLTISIHSVSKVSSLHELAAQSQIPKTRCE